MCLSVAGSYLVACLVIRRPACHSPKPSPRSRPESLSRLQENGGGSRQGRHVAGGIGPTRHRGHAPDPTVTRAMAGRASPSELPGAAKPADSMTPTALCQWARCSGSRGSGPSASAVVDAPSVSVGLDGAGRRLPPFDTGDALGKRAQDCRRVVRLAVGGGLAEPVLVTPEVLVQPGPGLDLGAVTADPGFAASLGGEEGLHVVIGSGPGLFGTRRVEGSQVRVGQLTGHVGRRVIGDPLAEGGVLPEGGIEVLGRHGRPGRQSSPGPWSAPGSGTGRRRGTGGRRAGRGRRRGGRSPTSGSPGRRRRGCSTAGPGTAGCSRPPGRGCRHRDRRCGPR